MKLILWEKYVIFSGLLMMLEINFDATNTISNDDRGKTNYEKFVKLSAKTMTYEDFFKNYMVKNLPWSYSRSNG